jgi:hypothetical protein
MNEPKHLKPIYSRFIDAHTIELLSLVIMRIELITGLIALNRYILDQAMQPVLETSDEIKDVSH